MCTTVELIATIRHTYQKNKKYLKRWKFVEPFLCEFKNKANQQQHRCCFDDDYVMMMMEANKTK